MNATAVALRVTVLDTWDEIAIDAPIDWTVRQIKEHALGEARVMADPGEFCVKFRGVELRDESRTSLDYELPMGAALVVLRRGRPPVR